MKLGSLKSASRDGQLVVVSQDLSSVVPVPEIAGSLREALENWAECEPKLQAVAKKLAAGELDNAQPFDATAMHSAMPRSFNWTDGSVYLSHMRLVRKSRGVDMPEGAEEVPLMYQGCGEVFLAPTEDIPLVDEGWGLDFESEVAVIVDDVPQGTKAADAAKYIKLVLICNDVSLRIVMKPELARGFGFYQSKPPTAFSPVCVTPDELGDAWTGAQLCLPIVSTLNGKEIGHPHAGHDCYFDFAHLIEHATVTRPLTAGTIIGSGTISNDDYETVGSSCLQEIRTIETIEQGEPKTPFMKVGDRIQIEVFDGSGRSIFGRIDQKVRQA